MTSEPSLIATHPEPSTTMSWIEWPPGCDPGKHFPKHLSGKSNYLDLVTEPRTFTYMRKQAGVGKTDIEKALGLEVSFQRTKQRGPRLVWCWASAEGWMRAAYRRLGRLPKVEDNEDLNQWIREQSRAFGTSVSNIREYGRYLGLDLGLDPQEGADAKPQARPRVPHNLARLKQVAALREGPEPLTFVEIGKIIGVSGSRAKQLYTQECRRRREVAAWEKTQDANLRTMPKEAQSA